MMIALLLIPGTRATRGPRHSASAPRNPGCRATDCYSTSSCPTTSTVRTHRREEQRRRPRSTVEGRATIGGIPSEHPARRARRPGRLSDTDRNDTLTITVRRDRDGSGGGGARALFANGDRHGAYEARVARHAIVRDDSSSVERHAAMTTVGPMARVHPPWAPPRRPRSFYVGTLSLANSRDNNG